MSRRLICADSYDAMMRGAYAADYSARDVTRVAARRCHGLRRYISARRYLMSYAMRARSQLLP